MSAAFFRKRWRTLAERRDELPPWETGPASESRTYRHADPERLKKIEPELARILAFARKHGLRIAWITLTVRGKGKFAEKLKRMLASWAKFRVRAPYRYPTKVLGAIKVVGLHGGRPHIHLFVVLAKGVSIDSVRDAWQGGFTHGALATATETLAAYCAGQVPTNRRRHAWGRRVLEFRRPRASCLDSVSLPSPPSPRPSRGSQDPSSPGSPSPSPDPRQSPAPELCAPTTASSPERVGCRGETCLAGATGDGERAPPSDGHRVSGDQSESPLGVRREAAPEPGALVEMGSPQGGSELVEHLAPNLAPANDNKFLKAAIPAAGGRGMKSMSKMTSTFRRNGPKTEIDTITFTGRPTTSGPMEAATVAPTTQPSTPQKPFVSPNVQQPFIPPTPPAVVSTTLPPKVDVPAVLVEAKPQEPFVPPAVTADDARHVSRRRAFDQRVESARRAIKPVVRHGKNCKRSEAEIVKAADIDPEVGFVALMELVADGVLEIFVDRTNLQVERWFWARSQADLVDDALW